MNLPAVDEVVEARLGHAVVKVTVSGVFGISCTHGPGCSVVEAVSEHGNAVVTYAHEGEAIQWEQ